MRFFERLQKQTADSWQPLKHASSHLPIRNTTLFSNIFHTQSLRATGLKLSAASIIRCKLSTFESTLQSMETAAANFPPSWKSEDLPEERAKAIRRWQAQIAEFSPLPIPAAKRVEACVAAKVLPMWHGTAHCESICRADLPFSANTISSIPQ